MRTSSRTVAVVLFDEVELLDVASVQSVLGTAGRQWNYRPFKLLPVAADARLVDTRSQLRIEAAGSFESVPAPEIVVVPGGYGARRALRDDRVTAYLRSVGPGADHVLGIGNGVLLLAQAGLTQDHDVAASAELEPVISELSPSVRVDSAARYRESGKLLTAATAGGAVDASLHLVSRLLGKKQAEIVAGALGYSFGEGAPGGVAIVDPAATET